MATRSFEGITVFFPRGDPLSFFPRGDPWGGRRGRHKLSSQGRARRASQALAPEGTHVGGGEGSKSSCPRGDPWGGRPRAARSLGPEGTHVVARASQALAPEGTHVGGGEGSKISCPKRAP